MTRANAIVKNNEELEVIVSILEQEGIDARIVETPKGIGITVNRGTGLASPVVYEATLKGHTAAASAEYIKTVLAEAGQHDGLAVEVQKIMDMPLEEAVKHMALRIQRDPGSPTDYLSRKVLDFIVYPVVNIETGNAQGCCRIPIGAFGICDQESEDMLFSNLMEKAEASFTSTPMNAFFDAEVNEHSFPLIFTCGTSGPGEQGSVGGGIALLCKKGIRKVAEKTGEDLLILPSSVHEVLAMPASCGMSPAEANQMVAEVNRMEVKEEEQVADHAYLYSLKVDKIFSLGEDGTSL